MWTFFKESPAKNLRMNFESEMNSDSNFVYNYGACGIIGL